MTVRAAREVVAWRILVGFQVGVAVLIVVVLLAVVLVGHLGGLFTQQAP